MSHNSESNNLEEIKALIASNARAIEALTEAQNETRRERVKLYQAMSDLAQTQARLAQAQANNQELMYRFLENIEQQQQQLSRRQGDIVEILKFLTKKEDKHDQ